MAGCYRTNQPTNERTNKHDGSQYLLVEVIIRTGLNIRPCSYLGFLIHCSGSSKPGIKRRSANIVRKAMFSLDQNMRRSSITLETKLRLCNTCILPIFTVRRSALHGLCDRNSVRPSVRLSVRPFVCHTRALCPHGSTYDHDFFTIW